jgi:hypothetical protein
VSGEQDKRIPRDRQNPPLLPVGRQHAPLLRKDLDRRARAKIPRLARRYCDVLLSDQEGKNASLKGDIHEGHPGNRDHRWT